MSDHTIYFDHKAKDADQIMVKLHQILSSSVHHYLSQNFVINGQTNDVSVNSGSGGVQNHQNNANHIPKTFKTTLNLPHYTLLPSSEVINNGTHKLLTVDNTFKNGGGSADGECLCCDFWFFVLLLLLQLHCLFTSITTRLLH